MSSPPNEPAVDLVGERDALERARLAVQAKLGDLAGISGGGADALADEYIDAVVRGAIEKLQQELVVFGRIDDDQPWRVGLYGIDEGGEQLVVDWRAPFAGAFYRASFAEPLGLSRRVSYVGAIDDLFIEELATGEVTGTAPLLGELSRERGTEMGAAVATLQSEQDDLVRLDPDATLVLRGGPGTGKTVVGLHRAAWLVYNDTRLTAGRILVIGPSDRFLRFVSSVLPTLGESKVVQTTFERLLGPSTATGSDPRWLPVLDRYFASQCRPAELKIGLTRIRIDDVAEAIATLQGRSLPYRDQRSGFVRLLAHRHGLRPGDVSKSAAEVWPPQTTTQVMRRLRNRGELESHGLQSDFVERWLAGPTDGALRDEVRARVEGVPATYGHVIVDEAQDLSLLQLRAVQRRASGLSLVGDDAQRSNPLGLGLRGAAAQLNVAVSELTTAYRTSAEIAGWLNAHARDHDIDAVQLVGIRPTGRPVRTAAPAPGALEAGVADLKTRWANVAVITAGNTWDHKGVEYDAVVVDQTAMSPAEVYLAASRAAHELLVVG